MIRLATESDEPRLVRTAWLAFADDPVMRWFFPTDEEYAAIGAEMFRYQMRRWRQWSETWTTDDGVAVAAWIPPGRPPIEVPGPPPVEPPAELADKFRAFGAAMAENTPDEPHWYLNLLATHPDWQRQGLGARLIEHVAQTAADDGLPLYLETETLANVAYYSHLGFVVRTEWDLPLDGPHMWGMVRSSTSLASLARSS